MTALKDIDKLETTGLWRANADAQRIEVYVSIGDATLVISDVTDKALSHWSLPAVRRRNRGVRPALYSPGRDDPEELEIEDPTMIEAIEQVRTAIKKAQPHPGRLRYLTLGVVAASLVALGTFWLPKALRDHTLRVLPETTRVLIGRSMLANITNLSGQPCQSSRSTTALSALNTRVLAGAGTTLVVLRHAAKPTMHLPGQLILLSGDLLEDYDQPAVVAGYLITEYMRSQSRDPLRAYLDYAGFGETFRLLTTGQADPALLKSYVELQLTRPPHALSQETVVEWFTQLRVPTSPYAWAMDPSGENTLTLIEADPYTTQNAPEVLSDADWLTLQNICQA